MEFRQTFFVLTFALLNFIENVASYWIVSILLEVVQKNLSVPKEQSSTVAGYFFAWFFFGMMVGSFIWPSFCHFISCRDAILIGFVLQMITNFLTGETKNLYAVYFWRFLYGLAHNLGTVGKSFIFDFAHLEYRHFVFSVKSSSSLVAACGAPLFGFYIYQRLDKDYFKSFAIISAMYLIGILFFAIAFYVFFDEKKNSESKQSLALGENKEKEDQAEEDQTLLIEEAQQEPESESKTKGVFEVLSIVFANKKLRWLLFCYLLVNGDYASRFFITIFYSEIAWTDQGLGLSPGTVSMLNFLILVPSVILILLTPWLIPSKISGIGFTKFVLLMSALTTLILPILRDLLPNNQGIYFWGICTCFLLSSFFNPNLFSPFLNLKMNNLVEKESRTAFNSISYLSSSFSILLLLTIFSPMFSMSMFDPNFQTHKPFSKYLCFLLLDLLLLLSYYCLKKQE